MSAKRVCVWIAECEICAVTKEFDADLSVEDLGTAMREAGWELPGYGGSFCPRCSRAVKTLSKKIVQK